jgi:hypothetical protein
MPYKNQWGWSYLNLCFFILKNYEDQNDEKSRNFYFYVDHKKTFLEVFFWNLDGLLDFLLSTFFLI